MTALTFIQKLGSGTPAFRPAITQLSFSLQIAFLSTANPKWDQEASGFRQQRARAALCAAIVAS